MTFVDLDDETITWSSQSNWTQLHDDGRVEYGDAILPPMFVLRKMACQIAKGQLSRIRHFAEEGDTPEAREIWDDLTQWMKGGDYTLEVTSKIDHSGWLVWSIVAREPGTDGLFSSGIYMDPSCALAWFIAVCWEYHKEWMSEQLSIVGGLA